MASPAEKFPGGADKLRRIEKESTPEKEWQEEIQEAGRKCGGRVLKDEVTSVEYLFPPTGIKMNFVEPVLKFTAKELPPEFNQHLFSEKVDDEFRQIAQRCFDELLQFLTGPIIADDLDSHQVQKKENGQYLPIIKEEEHVIRRLWEFNYDSYRFPKAVENYYHSNRLSANLVNSLKQFTMMLDVRAYRMERRGEGTIFKDPDMLERLQKIVSKLPDGLREPEFAGYRDSDLNGKIAMMEEAAPMILEAVQLLGLPRQKK